MARRFFLCAAHRYECLKDESHGSEGTVFKSFDHREKRVVAIKEWDLATEAGRLGYEQEITALQVLSPTVPGLISLHDTWRTASHGYMVTDWYDGNVEQLFGQPCFILPLANFLFHTVSQIHQQQWWHGDLKPLNLLYRWNSAILDRSGSQPQPRSPFRSVQFALADFGHARQITAQMEPDDRMGQGGTFDYLSPERCCNDTPWEERIHGFASDWWAVGVTLFQCCTESLPFYHPNRQQTIENIVHHPANWSLFHAASPFEGKSELQRFITACLLKNPKERLQTLSSWKMACIPTTK